MRCVFLLSGSLVLITRQIAKYLVIHCNYMFTQCTVLTEVYPSYRIIGHLHTAQERSNEYTVYVVFIQVSYHIKK